MNLKVNGRDIDVTLEGEKTVGDFLRSFEEEAAKNQSTTVSVTLNGKELSADEIDGVLDEEIGEDTLIELETVSKDAVTSTLHSLAGRIAGVNERLHDVSVLLQGGKDGEVKEIINSLADCVEDLVHASRMASLFPELYGQIQDGGVQLDEMFKTLYPVLNDLYRAMEDHDSVTVGDLSEYEISPWLEKITGALQIL